jgi:hypothetical protein
MLTPIVVDNQPPSDPHVSGHSCANAYHVGSKCLLGGAYEVNMLLVKHDMAQLSMAIQNELELY